MAALQDVWRSERGIIGVALIIAATVLAALAVISGQDWLDYSWKIFAVYVAGKTATGAVEAATRNKTERISISTEVKPK